MFKSWQALTALILVGVVLLGSGMGKSIHTSLLGSQPAIAQTFIPSDVWRQVYQQLPDFPRENKYVSKETGKVAENNTLVSRLIRYHVYVKGRAPNYRLDWKLTLADYLGANEIMYDNSYPGNDTLRQNPIEGDRAVIKRLNRQQREALVQALTNAYNPNQKTSAPTPDSSSQPQQAPPTPPQQPKPGDAQKLR
ncbi:MAG: hypothetical protein DSM106950_25080 [Stigonema ocellatum SAG 48.90 = DSM 106950]|nr:hypothetical protein [Stigonema ocellatum SAG 48.90 = DSM 106950]